MTAQAIKNFLDATPFRPFTLVTALGKSYSVPHPEHVVFTPNRRVAFVFSDAELYDALDVMTVTEIIHGGPRSGAKRRKVA